ncbi:MAG TPA: hypothetical protein VFN10_10625 [Thermoanaerobaculia bacterium]|nr:hypothetical protein [Thermoanaerobaculia bacterium]
MCLVLAAALPFVASADPVGKVSVSAGGVDINPQSSGFDKLLITVQAPDGTVFTKEVANGHSAALRLNDFPGHLLQEGTYSYDIRVVPRISGSVKAQLAAAREANDDAAIATIRKQAGIDRDVVQSGAFTVLNGAFVSSDGTEPTAHDSSSRSTGQSSDAVANEGSTPANRGPVTSAAHVPFVPQTDDQVIPDDLIVQSSLCVGFDCVDGESFGTDTIRLKENNTRIKFDDTSTSAGYANNDWQLTANDQPSGGANKFSVDDITNSKTPFTIEGNTPTNALYVDSTGFIGLGNSAPGLLLHLTKSDTPGIRLEQTNSGGFTAQTWDVAGNEANFFVRDLTGGSRLPFRIRPGAPTSSIDIAASGNVGIGTASPATKLDIDPDSNTAGVRVRGLAEASEIGELFVGQNGNFVMSVTNGTGTQPIIDLRPKDDQFGVVIRESTGTTTFPYANFFVTDTTDDYLSIDVNSVKTGAFTLTAAGKVGIGTTTPSSKFHVNGGDIRVTGGSFIDDGVTLNAPDYVFENDYNLMPIDKVASFIKENKHLPNVPSAKEIKASGLNMSQFQMRLLEKVEELTLYTLDQHEQIGTLKAENDKLMERLNALEQQVAKQQ